MATSSLTFKSLQEFLPSNRREILLVLVGSALSFGLGSIPGLTVEPKALTECRAEAIKLEAGLQSDLAICQAAKATLIENVVDLKERVQYCRDNSALLPTPP